MELLLVLPLLLVAQLLPLAVVVAPPLVMAVRHRRSLPAVALWLGGLALLVAWSAAGSADMDRADATGGEGSIWAGVGWLIAAAVAAGAAVRTTVRAAGPAVPGR